jgi:molybdenum cofactor synthesis domain-containing protein
VTPDEQQQIVEALRQLCAEADLVATTGGTGVAARDVTPDATLALSPRVVPGLAERMRAEGAKSTLMAYLSRATAVSYQRSLVINLPGSPKGATESLRAVLPLLGHAIDLLRGKTEH